MFRFVSNGQFLNVSRFSLWLFLTSKTALRRSQEVWTFLAPGTAFPCLLHIQVLRWFPIRFLTLLGFLSVLYFSLECSWNDLFWGFLGSCFHYWDVDMLVLIKSRNLSVSIGCAIWALFSGCLLPIGIMKNDRFRQQAIPQGFTTVKSKSHA